MFSNSKIYKEGDIVVRGGKIYICKADLSEAGEWDETQWEETDLVTVNNYYNTKLDEMQSSNEHDCNLYLVEKYDEHHHWDECSFCNEKYNEEEHHFVTMGNPSCIWSSNGLTSYCIDCGYSYNHKNRHTDDTSHWETRVDAKWHYYKCTICGSYGSVQESCIDADGNPITCKGGTCAVCGYTYPANVHSMYSSTGGESGTVTCNGCGEEMIAFDQNKAEWIGDNKVHLSARITWWNPGVFGSDINALASTVRMGGTGSGITGQNSDMQVTVQNGAIYMSCNVTYPYEDALRKLLAEFNMQVPQECGL